MAERLAFSRSGASCPLGKRTVMVRANVPDETAELLRKMAREAGFDTESEYLAYVLMIHAHGFDRVAKLSINRLRVIARKRQE